MHGSPPKIPNRNRAAQAANPSLPNSPRTPGGKRKTKSILMVRDPDGIERAVHPDDTRQDARGYLQRFRDCLPSLPSRWQIFSFFLSNSELAISLFLNFTRDYVWSVYSYTNWDVANKQTDDYVEQTFTQWLYATAAMGVAAFSAYGIWRTYWAAKKAPAPAFPLSHTGAALTAASAAIVTWNLGQYYGTKFFQGYGFSDEQSAYMASIFTGGAEGPTQWLIQRLWKAICAWRNGEPINNWTSYNGCQRAVRITLEFGLNVTLGAVPGGVWQLVFARDFAGATPNPDPTPYHLAAGGALVAIHVCAANRLFDFVSNVFLSAAERWKFFAAAPAGYKQLSQADDDLERGPDSEA